jgi:hypothetical protein
MAEERGPGAAGNAAPHAREEKTARQTAFLDAYCACGFIGRAAADAGVDRRTVQRWAAADPAFADAMEDARATYVERLEAEADRRGVEGVEKPVGWYKGEAGGTVREYSDSLLVTRLKALAPDRYADRVNVESRHLVAQLVAIRSQLPDDLVALGARDPMALLARLQDRSSLPPEVARLLPAKAPPAGGADGE